MLILKYHLLFFRHKLHSSFAKVNLQYKIKPCSIPTQLHRLFLELPVVLVSNDYFLRFDVKDYSELLVVAVRLLVVDEAEDHVLF